MPRKGYKSITVSDEVHDLFRQEWSKNKKEYIKKGITTFQGFLLYRFNETSTISIPRFLRINGDATGILIFDNELKGNKSVHISFRPNGINCDFHDRDNCEHIPRND